MKAHILTKIFCYVFDPLCPLCTRRILSFALCSHCACWPEIRRVPSKNWIFSTYQLTAPARRLLHSIKYHQHTERLPLLRPLLPDSFPKVLDPKTVLIPVPLSPKRFFERGFNQAEWLAREMGKRTSLRMETRGLIKVIETNSQSTLSKRDRKNNLKGAFEWNQKRTIPDRVCLIDDVVTTGSTLEACRAILLKAGVKEVLGWTLFKTTASVLHCSQNI